MFVELLCSILLGVLSGIITGLIPGIHVNLISVIVVSSSALLLNITSPINIAVFIISLALTHSFLDSIPSIYLGAPDEAQALNALPGHRLLLEGIGHNAIVYTLLGSFGSLLVGVILFPLFVIAMEKIYPLVNDLIGYILILIMAYMILKDKGKRLKSMAAFFLSGTLGILIFSVPTLNQPLFPLLSGLFGFSLLFVSLADQTQIPPQKKHDSLKISNKNLTKAVGAASAVGFIAAFLPGFGSSQAAIVATNIVGDIGDEGFLTLVGGINTANMLISIATIYILEKARNGAIIAVSSIMETVQLRHVVLFVAVALIVAGLATLLALKISRLFAKFIVKVNYATIVWSIIVFITALTILFDGFIGLLILTVATALGLVTNYWGVGKNHLMGCLILPVILFFIL